MSEFQGSEIEVVDDKNNVISGGKKPLDKKDMIKNVAIAFLSVMLVLTFFSNTIMNYSLPQVATQQISSGSISPQIRGAGTVSAEDPYNVTLKETRKVSSVAVKEGSHVEIGDVIYYLEDKESEELKTAKDKLEEMELTYEQTLFSGDIPDDVISRVRSGRSTSFDSYQIQLRQASEKVDAAKLTVDNYQAVYDAAQKAYDYLDKLKSHDTNEISYNKDSYGYENALADYNIALIDSNNDLSDEAKESAKDYWYKVKNKNTRETTELATYSSQVSTGYEQKKLEAGENRNNAEKNLEDAKKDWEEAKEEKDKLVTSIRTETSLCNTRDKITAQKKKIAELEAASVGASVKAPVAGILSSVSKAAGESISADETIAVIQIDGKDMTTSFSVTNAQAQKLRVGDAAKPQNAWMFSNDFKATLVSIKNDKTDPSGKKLLTFKIESSEVTPGQNLALAIGERSIDYDMIVPNSAIKTGGAGKFVLVVNSKSSPLGNRYITSAVEVSVIASDDNYTAITAALNGDEFVVTTSTRSVKAGEQVRLANE